MSSSGSDNSSSNSRIREDVLEYENEELVLDGIPFTGIGYAEYPNGKIRREVTYEDGFPKGQCREWYENGQLSKEWHAERGVAPSKTTEWDEEGKIKSECIREHGVELKYREWGKDGKLVDERNIIEGTPMHELLLRMRKLKNKA